MRLNLIVLRVAAVDRSADFYRALGLVLTREQHGTGPEHYSANLEGTILELYPRRGPHQSTSGLRLGLTAASLEELVEVAVTAGGTLVSSAKQSPWGFRAEIKDPDGHTIELIESVAAR